MERIDVVDIFSGRDKWLDERIQVVINDCEIIESFRAKPRYSKHRYSKTASAD